MTILKVNEIQCENCTKRISNALSEAGLKFEVSLTTKTVIIDGNEAEVKKAIEELDDLGFSAIIM